MQIGAQLYSAFKRTQTLEDFSQTLKKVAEIGYKTVQVSGTCSYEPEWLRDELLKNDLKCVLTHKSTEEILEKGADKIVAEHAVFGCKNIGIGMLPIYTGKSAWTFENYHIFRDKFVPVAKRMQELGAQLHYHNHFYEYQNEFVEKNLIECMLEDFPEGSLAITLDIGWAAFADQDVVKVIERLNGYISRVHLKDYKLPIPEGLDENLAYLRPIYEGMLDYDEIIKALAKTDCEYMLVEQDNCYGEDEFDCLRRSYENVTSRFPSTK